MQKDAIAIKNEARSGVIEHFHNHAVAHQTNEEGESIENMIQWVKSARMFRKNTRKSGQQDIRNLLLMS